MPTFEITQGGKKYRVTVPDGQTQEDAYKHLEGYLSAQPTTASGELSDAVSGVGQGLVGDVVGAGQVAQTVAPGLAEKVKSIPGVRSTARAARDWAEAPSQSWGQTLGRAAGGALPFAFAPEAAGGPLAALAARAALGGLAGAVQPTEGSHIPGAIAGAATGGLMTPPIAGRIAQLGGGLGTWAALDQLARTIGRSPFEVAAALGLGGYWSGLGSMARSVGAKTGQIADKVSGAIPAGTVGAVSGQAAPTVEREAQTFQGQ